MPHVTFVLPANAHLLDVAGAAQVFSTLADLGLPWTLDFVGAEPVASTRQGLGLAAGTTWPDRSTAADDLVVVPGWSVQRRPVPQEVAPHLLDRVRAHHEAGGTVMSVCAGAFALAACGLLDGRRATTHHALQAELERRHPLVQVVRDVLFVEDDRVLTSAGIASGIDLALQVAARHHGPAVAARAARAMVVYARRNGPQAQESVMLRHRDHVDDLVHRVQDVIDERFAERLPLADLADEVGVSARTLTRAFARSVGTTPLRYQQSVRLEHAELLIAAGRSVESAARSAGFEDARMLRRLRSR